jgi:hypothetical protein
MPIPPPSLDATRFLELGAIGQSAAAEREHRSQARSLVVAIAVMWLSPHARLIFACSTTDRVAGARCDAHGPKVNRAARCDL